MIKFVEDLLGIFSICSQFAICYTVCFCTYSSNTVRGLTRGRMLISEFCTA